MQFPELFGSPYIFPGILAAVVILLALLILSVVRRRKRATMATREEPEFAVTQPTGKRAARPERAGRRAQAAQAGGGEPSPPTGRGRRSTYVSAGAGAAAALSPQAAPTPSTVSPEPAVTPTPPERRPAPAPRVQSVPIEDILPGSDPLQAIIVEILGGWGDLTQEDTNRLEVFRPDRVVAALTTADVPRELKNSEYARARLTQLRRWAGSLERREEPRRAPDREYAGIDGSQIAAAAVPAAAAAAAVAAAPTMPATPAMPTVPPLAPPAQTAPATPAMPTVSSVPTVQATPPIATQPIAEPQRAAEEAAMVPGSAKPFDPWENETAEPNKSTEKAIAAAAAAFWARPEAAGGPQAPGQVVATPVAPQAPSEQAPPPPPQLPPQAPVLSIPESLTTREEMTSDNFLADLAGKINTADALMALPVADQANMLAFLKPSELAKVLHATKDTELKKAVIDTLESVGSPTALDIIYQCLDDPDPQIQMRALDAADRLLGAE